MPNYRQAALLFLLLLIAPVSYADDDCESVLKYAAKNESDDSYHLARTIKIYDRYCENETYKNSDHLDSDSEAVINYIPYKFKLSSGSNEAKLKHFCKEFSSDYRNNEVRFNSISAVNDASVNAWFQCKALAARGVKFTPTIGKSHILISIKRTSADDVVLQRMTYDVNALTCNHKITAGDTVEINTELPSGTYVINCTRSQKPVGSEKQYPETELSIITDAGPFLLKIPADSVLPYQWASEIQQIQKLQEAAFNERVQGLEREIREINSRGRVLAIIDVVGREIKYGSPGTSYDPDTGVITFSNPNKLDYVPLITDYGVNAYNKNYLTSTNFIFPNFVSPNKNQIKIWETPLDTGDKNNAPVSFTAVVVGYQK